MNRCQIYIPITFTDQTVSLSSPVINWMWDFGDGSTSTSQNPTHTFLGPAFYTVSLTACNMAGCATYTEQVYVFDKLPGEMYFCSVPPPSEATQRNRYPFTICLSSPLTGENMIHLYSQFSNSQPYEATADSKWNHLLPTWYFEDLNGNKIDTIMADTTTVYVSGCSVGSIGTAEFYYIDDMPTKENNPLLIWATLELSGLATDLFDNQELPSYANSKVLAATPYVINGQNPDHLEITRNGIAPINKLKWTGVTFPYVITINGEFSGCGAGAFPVIFDYPSANDVGFEYLINRSLVNISNSAISWTADPDYFIRYDNQGLYAGGFERGTVVSENSSLNTQISAAVGVRFFPTYREVPYVWVSNPENKTLNRISYPISLSQTVINELTSTPLGLPITGLTDVKYGTPYITQIDPTNLWSFSGYGGIFGIAVDPCYDIWATDAEMDYIYKFDIEGTLLSSICLTDATQITGVSAGCTPAAISLTRDFEFWVTLFDSVSVLKFDENGNYKYSIYPANDVDIMDNNAYMPTIAVPDRDENLWVSYASPYSSVVIKYATTDVSATEMFRLDLPTSSTPIDMVVDGLDNSVWITNANVFMHDFGSVKHYSTSGVLLTSMDFARPSYITLDRWGGTWFGYGFNNIAYIPSGMSPILFSVSGGNISTSLNFDEYDDTAIGGIAADVKGGVWIISNLENKVYRVSATSDFGSLSTTLLSFDIHPTTNNNWTIMGGQYVVYSDPQAHRSAQAFGDWTGYRWIRTYKTLTLDTATTITKVITGISDTFNLKQFENQNIIRRQNESWDAAEQIREYALSDHVNAYYNLFEGYIKGMLGGNETEDQHVGRLSYERIANFVENNNNIDTSNFLQLYSIAEEFGVPIDDYKLSYPLDLRRMLDIASVSHQNLWGARCKCDKNFNYSSTYCTNCKHYHCSNLGSQFYYTTAVLTAGNKFVVKPTMGKVSYDIIEPVSYNGLSSYPISSIPAVSWLASADYGTYDFYWHLSSYCNTQVEGVINWGDEYTTLSENNSSLSAWYGNYGILEEMFDYQLHKGLNLQE